MVAEANSGGPQTPEADTHTHTQQCVCVREGCRPAAVDVRGVVRACTSLHQRGEGGEHGKTRCVRVLIGPLPCCWWACVCVRTRDRSS